MGSLIQVSLVLTSKKFLQETVQSPAKAEELFAAKPANPFWEERRSRNCSTYKCTDNVLCFSPSSTRHPLLCASKAGSTCKRGKLQPTVLLKPLPSPHLPAQRCWRRTLALTGLLHRGRSALSRSQRKPDKNAAFPWKSRRFTFQAAFSRKEL